MEKKTAVAYVRVSDPGQAEEELSIPSQVERCRAKAAELGAVVVRVFADEGKSGRSDTRPAFREAISYCESVPTDFLITWSTSRFARNKVDAALYKMRLDAASTGIVYVSQTFDREDDTGWMTESMFEIFDEMQSRMIAKDTRRSMETNARNGNWNGGAVPLGYRVVPDSSNAKRRRLLPNEAEAETVRSIFEMRASGVGAKTIAWKLNEQGISNRGRRWNKHAVLGLLRNETVVGNIVFGRRRGRTKKIQPREKWIVVKSHDGIVDPNTFAAVQEMLNRADMRNDCDGSSMRSNFVFTGMLRCGDCGGAMTTSSATGRSKVYHYYDCRNAIERRGCKSRRISADRLDQWMVTKICERIFEPGRLHKLAAELQASSASWQVAQRRKSAVLARQIDDATARRSRLYEVLETYGKDAPDLRDLMARIRELGTTIEITTRELANVRAETPPDYKVDVAQLSDALTTVVRAEDPKKLRQFFSGFIDRITVKDRDAQVEYRPEKLLVANGAVRGKEGWLPGTD